MPNSRSPLSLKKYLCSDKEQEGDNNLDQLEPIQDDNAYNNMMLGELDPKTSISVQEMIEVNLLCQVAGVMRYQRKCIQTQNGKIWV